MGEFLDATQVSRRVEPTAAGALVYDTAIAPGWDIAGNANGGYLMAVAGRAMADAAGRPPLSLTAHYLAPGRPGPATVDVEVHRAGRRTATIGASLRGESGEVLRLLGTFAELREEGPAAIEAAPPELPPIGACIRVVPPAEMSGFGDRVDMYVHPDDAGFRNGQPRGTAEIRGWFEFVDQSPVDALGLLVAADAFPPVVFNRGEFPISWAPTLELTVHLRAVPAPGPLRCRFSSRFMQAGMFEEDGELWDANGTLVAQSRQLALIPRG